jgi:hypothetical protein
MQLLVPLACASAAYALYSITSTFVTSYRNASKARALKCEEPPMLKTRSPFGIDNLLRAIAAAKAQFFPYI